MKVVQINATCGNGSTGKICLAVSKLLSEKGIENYILYTQGDSDYEFGIKYSSDHYKTMQALISRIFGNWGFNSNGATHKLLKHLDRINPDVIHIHNVHAHDCNLDLLFNYIRKKNIKVFWTFHDCWAFTGYCVHFTIADCNKWKSECKNCPQSKKYSWIFDRSNSNFHRKKRLFQGLDITIVTPSRWLADLVKQSFLKDCTVKVINNGIDLSVFKPTKGDFKKKYKLEDKRIILGVSYIWDFSKGLDVFIELSKILDDNYKIVLVGTNPEIDKELPNNIISIHKTENQRELAEIYSVADVFLNPTREDNYPTVDMEAIACGTPVISFDTGGSKEIIDESCGCCVSADKSEILEKISYFCKFKNQFMEKCINKSLVFSQDSKYMEYVSLYENIISKT